MPIRTIIDCDCGCKKSLEIGDKETPGAEEIIEVNDAMGVKHIFISTACFKKWAATYVCPLKRPLNSEQDVPLDAMLPGDAN